MAEGSKGWTRFGVFVAGAGGVLAIAISVLQLYDRATKPSSEIIGLVSANIATLPPDVVLSARAVPSSSPVAVDEQVGEGWSEAALERQANAQTMVFVLVRNTGTLPANGVTLTLDPIFSASAFTDEDGRQHVLQEPRRVSLGKLRAGQVVGVSSWTVTKIVDIQPNQLVKRISLTHNDGMGSLKIDGGVWANFIELESNRRQLWIAIPMLLMSLLGGLFAIRVQAKTRERLLKRLLEEHRAHVIDGGSA
ncbi:hypothetical protein [Xanthomonas arboricola]|uniref:hypothetical protein n=1 Tax=Xanthomonas arboricola TaxID=56448 RepID=UPI000CB69867|nr:hypothetical protein [Xanthomonas arboricola]SOT98143.1 hypothetical protein CFBP6773_01869 [Xanthomonas arboricola pv. fragariae]